MNPIALRCLALLLVVTASTACADFGRKSNYYSVNADGTRSKKYSRVNQYTSYGTGGLGAQAKVAAAYEEAQHAPAPSIDVQVLNAALPAGVTLEGGTIKIAPDAPFEAIGRFEVAYWLSSAPQETEVEDDLKRLASVTSSNVVVVEVTRMGHGDPRVNFISGILLRKGGAGAPGSQPTAAVVQPTRGGARSRARLVYAANAYGCLSAAEFADEVSARLGYSPWVEDSAIEIHTELVANGKAFRATVKLADGTKKTLTGVTCKVLTDAVISTVVVQLDSSPKRFD